MHILLIHQAFASLDEPGGTRHYEIARKLVAGGHRVTVITGELNYLTGKTLRSKEGQDEKIHEEGMRILKSFAYHGYHKSFPQRILSYLSFMVSSLLKGFSVRKVNVVWGTSPPLFQAFAAWFLARLKGAGFLFEVRDLWPSFAVALGILHNPILIRLSEVMERFLYRHADNIVVNSPGFRQHVLDHGGQSVETVANAVDAAMFLRETDVALYRREHQLEGKFVITYAGAHGVSNDLELLIDSAYALRENSKICFVLVGDGKEKANLVQKAKSLELNNVRFQSPQAKDAMFEVLAAADVCVALLKPIEEFKTTYPNKVFDYMAAGKPILLAIDGVIREVVEQAKCGIFVQPGDQTAMVEGILRLEQDRSSVIAMGAAGRRYVQDKFDRDTQVEAMLSALTQVVDQ